MFVKLEVNDMGMQSMSCNMLILNSNTNILNFPVTIFFFFFG